MTIKRFEDLDIWRDARAICREIHTISVETDLRNDFKLLGQVKDSSGSIMDNKSSFQGNKFKSGV